MLINQPKLVLFKSNVLHMFLRWVYVQG